MRICTICIKYKKGFEKHFHIFNDKIRYVKFNLFKHGGKPFTCPYEDYFFESMMNEINQKIDGRHFKYKKNL